MRRRRMLGPDQNPDRRLQLRVWACLMRPKRWAGVTILVDASRTAFSACRLMMIAAQKPVMLRRVLDPAMRKFSFALGLTLRRAPFRRTMSRAGMLGESATSSSAEETVCKE
jgi:hypothetical protein